MGRKDREGTCGDRRVGIHRGQKDSRVIKAAQQIKDSCRACFSAAAKSWVELNPKTVFRYGVSTLARKHRALNGVELCGRGRRASSVSGRENDGMGVFRDRRFLKISEADTLRRWRTAR